MLEQSISGPAKTDRLQLSKNAITVLEKRYLKKDQRGRPVEAPEDLFRRVAKNIASAETKYDPNIDLEAIEQEFFWAMAKLEFLPNSPTLMNAGRELQQLSACFVLPVEDSMESIFEAVKYSALVHKSGGGTGFSFSRIRPVNDRVQSTGGVASGPVSFMRVFDAATDAVKQGGTRRGANMAILNVNHPDILDFITCKEDEHAFNNFNISVAVTEEFMEAVDRGADYELINPHTGEVTGKLKAREVFDKIVEVAWKNGEPGMIFLDRINRFNPTPRVGSIESTNPCGEQPLLPYESCNLGSINLAKMVRRKDGEVSIDYNKLAKTVGVAVRFLDNVIDMNNYPLPKIGELTKANRKIGLGVMGFADMLIQLGIPYNSEDALKVADEVMKSLREHGRETSAELAEKRGPFPNFKGSIYDTPRGVPLRNATITTIAPTGTLSIIANCSSGIEPLFAVSYVRNVLDGQQLIEVNPYFEEAAKSGGFHSKALMEKIAKAGSIQGMPEIPKPIQDIFVTAHDISPEWHVKMQAVFQKHTDNAVSKTVNFRHDATVDDVRKVFLLAFEEGCKGITLYRDRSRDRQVLSTKTAEAPVVERGKLVPRARPKLTVGVTEKLETGCGNLYITINEDGKGLCELFAQMGKSGGCPASQIEAIGRLVSLALRSGVEPSAIVKQLKGIRCPSPSWGNGGHKVLSCADGISKAMEHYLARHEEFAVESSELEVKEITGMCPDCESMLVYADGCATCPACGYSKCG